MSWTKNFILLTFHALLHLNINQNFPQSSNSINSFHLSPPIKSTKNVSLLSHRISTDFDNKLNRLLRSHNHALIAAHFHHFINFYLLFFSSANHTKNKCRFSAIRPNFGGSFNIFSLSHPKHISFNHNITLTSSPIKIFQLFHENIIIYANGSAKFQNESNGISYIPILD